MKPPVRTFVAKTILAILVLTLAGAGLVLAWFYTYSGDIKGIESIGSFAPNEPRMLYGDCHSSVSVRAIPFKSLGKNLVNAVRAAEGDDEQMLSLQIARTLLCDHHGKMLQRHLLEYKAAAQLRRQFNQPELLTIYLNGAFFGDTLAGVDNASQHFYRKDPADLTVPEAAMIASLIRAPRFYSPALHPDRAKQRRDDVIAVMLKRGTITQREAEEAMLTPVPHWN